jgi:hypothetical protein
MDFAGKLFGWGSVGISGVELITNMIKDPGSAETNKAAVDVAFDVATALSLDFPPAALGVFAVHMGVDYLMDHPEVTKAIGDGVADTAKAVGNLAETTFKAGVEIGKAEVEVGKAVINGGVNVVKSIFHW